MTESTAPLRSRRSYRAPVVMDVDERQGLSADPVNDFTSADSLEAAPAAPAPLSRRAALEAERSRGRAKAEGRQREVRQRVVVKPSRPDRRALKAAKAEAARTEVARSHGPSVADPARPAHPQSGIYRRLHVGDRRRWGFHTVVLLALTAFFGTAALPAYAYTGEGSTIGNAKTALAVQTLTGGTNTVAQVVAREGLSIEESPAALDSTTNDSVSPTVQALAVQLMGAVASGRLVGSTPNHIPEIANLAEGKVVPGCGVDYRVLQAISVALDNFSQVGVSDINRRCTGQIEGAGTESAHYADGGGHAVDFYLLNGRPLTGGDEMSLQLIHVLDPLVPNGTGLGQVECRASISLENFKPFSDTCNHVHIDFLKSDGATLRYG
ncbi:hypothetical protein [uncultured Leifsonia sp.]|uniref:hypothetical protein n=1 Tax=uncultured Leifsonia sp. TaxID=340359 RepID=UPI0028D8C9CD|nr:hypothetical protein [uncultured Leifsonia sp.]